MNTRLILQPKLPDMAAFCLGGRIVASILFTGVVSYKEYLRIFAESHYFTSEEKHLFCGVNGKLFLFEEKTTTKRIEMDEEVDVG